MPALKGHIPAALGGRRAPLGQSRALPDGFPARGRSCVCPPEEQHAAPTPSRARGGVQRAETGGPVKPRARASWPGAHAPPWEPERLDSRVPARHLKVWTPQPGVPESLHPPHPPAPACIPTPGYSIPGSLHPCGAFQGLCIPDLASLPGVPSPGKNAWESQTAWLLLASAFPAKLAGTTHLYTATNLGHLNKI